MLTNQDQERELSNQSEHRFVPSLYPWSWSWVCYINTHLSSTSGDRCQVSTVLTLWSLSSTWPPTRDIAHVHLISPMLWYISDMMLMHCVIGNPFYHAWSNCAINLIRHIMCIIKPMLCNTVISTFIAILWLVFTIHQPIIISCIVLCKIIPCQFVIYFKNWKQECF